MLPRSGQGVSLSSLSPSPLFFHLLRQSIYIMGIFSCGSAKDFEPVKAQAYVGQYNPPGATRAERERVVAAASRSNSVGSNSSQSSTSSTNSTSSSVHHQTRSASAPPLQSVQARSGRSVPGHAGSGSNMRRQASIHVSIFCPIASALNCLFQRKQVRGHSRHR